MDFKTGQVKRVTIRDDGVTTTYNMDNPLTLDGRVITQLSEGKNLGTGETVFAFFADKDFEGRDNPHIVAKLAPDSKVPETVYYPPLVTVPAPSATPQPVTPEEAAEAINANP